MLNARVVFATSMFLGLSLSGCGGKSSEGGAASASAAVSAAPAPPPKPTPTATATAAAEGEETKGLHLHLESVKVIKGKAEGAEKVLKQHMLKLRTTCIKGEAKKEAIDGTLKVTIELAKDGKPEKIVTAVPTGKVPEDVATCVKAFYEKQLEIDTGKGKATLEVNIEMGPKVQPDK